ENPEPLSGSIFKTKKGELGFLIKIVGKTDLSFARHEMEDYSIHLLLVRKEVQEADIQRFEKSSDYLEHIQMKAVEIINRSTEAEVRQSYDNIIKLINCFNEPEPIG